MYTDRTNDDSFDMLDIWKRRRRGYYDRGRFQMKMVPYLSWGVKNNVTVTLIRIWGVIRLTDLPLVYFMNVMYGIYDVPQTGFSVSTHCSL